jgi:hypothetical protein
MSLFFDDVKGPHDLVLHPPQACTVDGNQVAISNVECKNSDGQNVPLLFRIRKRIQETIFNAKTRAYIDINLDDHISEYMHTTLDTYVRSAVFSIHSQPQYFNKVIPQNIMDRYYTPSISSDEASQWLRVRMDFNPSEKQGVVILNEITNSNTVRQNDKATSLDPYNGKDGEYVVCLSNIRFMKTSYRCDYILKSIDVNISDSTVTPTEEPQEQEQEQEQEHEPVTVSPLVNLAKEIIMNNETRGAARVSEESGAIAVNVANEETNDACQTTVEPAEPVHAAAEAIEENTEVAPVTTSNEAHLEDVSDKTPAPQKQVTIQGALLDTGDDTAAIEEESAPITELTEKTTDDEVVAEAQSLEVINVPKKKVQQEHSTVAKPKTRRRAGMSERKLMVNRQAKYVDRLKNLQSEVEHDVEVALQKRDCIRSDYSEAVSSLSELKDGADSTTSLREKDGYTTDDEMIRQDVEDALDC